MHRTLNLTRRVRLAALLLAWLAVWIVFGAARESLAKGGPDDKAELDRLQGLAKSIHWQDGPGIGKLGNVAEIKIPEGYRFTDQQGAAAFAELTQNIPDPSELGVLVSESGHWYISFSYDDSGHVPDDEKGKLDANAILTQLRAGNDQGNIERRRRGWPELTLVGWISPPAYDEDTHHLVWALRNKVNGQGEGANHNTKILGRTGVMSATLVISTENLETALPTVKKLLGGFDFTAGNKYGEWRAGDKVAQYGLTGLITGGAVVGAAKLGLLSKLGVLIAKGGKAIVVGIAALAAAIWKFLTGRGRRRQTE